MKKENLITILIVIFVVLLGVLYVERDKKKNSILIPIQQQENINEEYENNIDTEIILPQIPQTPYTKEICQKFVDEYSCKEGTITNEGLTNCNPQYSRIKVRCQAFLDGREDPYGGNYGTQNKNFDQEIDIFGTLIYIPVDWDVIENRYQTPAMSYEGTPGDIVGYALKPNFSDAQDDIILIGGRQVNICGNEFNLNYRYCNNKKIGNVLVPIYTNSENEKVLSFFESFTN